MNKKLTIIKYHYVRDIKNSKYPQIKGIEIDEFKEQIGFLKKNYHFLKMEELINMIQNDISIPNKSVLLTFDDAYIDHYKNVFPILHKEKIQGSFFVPVGSIANNTILDVNKIHFILAHIDNCNKLVKLIFNELDKYRIEYNLESNIYYFNKLAIKSRFDIPEVMFIKRILQVELNPVLRKIILNNLYDNIININEAEFSKELYMDIEQIKIMLAEGMHIGSHGYNHVWLNSLEQKEQRFEVEESLNFLKKLNVDLNYWTICYPYGGYNDSLIDILKNFGCKLGLTTKTDITDISVNNRFELPRLDTIDFPMKIDAEVNKWYYLG